MPDISAECGAECACGTVANALGKFGEADVRLAQEILGDGHTPTQQILHRRHADGTCKAIKKHRARERGLLGKRLDGPGSRGIAHASPVSQLQRDTRDERAAALSKFLEGHHIDDPVAHAAIVEYLVEQTAP